MTTSASTFFKIIKGSKQLSFGPRSQTNFNYVDFEKGSDPVIGNFATMLKQMNDSFTINVVRKSTENNSILELKLTNQSILTWEDYWIDPESKTIIDPGIHKINLQKNELVHANFNLPREKLQELNLEGNLSMQALFITESPNLEILNISNCPGLDVINIGLNGGIRALLARNCFFTPIALRRLLRDFRPIKTASSNTNFSLFKKKYETLLDLRGTEIDWSDNKISSKIRLLLCNNWLVLWDNPPPQTIIPPHMYSFFTNSLEDSLIKEYYKN